MDDRRQKIQLELAWGEEARGEAPKIFPTGTESSAAKRGVESPAITEPLMEEVCERENCKQALKRVKANKGSPGVDGMTVRELPGYLNYVPIPVLCPFRRSHAPLTAGRVLMAT